VSEEFICAGCRELMGNMERYKDVILGGGASLYFFCKVVNGVNGGVKRRVVTPFHQFHQRDNLFETFDIPVKNASWSIHGVDQYKLHAEDLVYFPALANHQDKIGSDQKIEEKYDWPPMVDYESLKTWLTKGLYCVLHQSKSSLSDLHSGAISITWCEETMKKGSVMVVIHSEKEAAFEGHIVAVLFKPQQKTQIYAVFLSPKLFHQR
jgi:hypothetical protein